MTGEFGGISPEDWLDVAPEAAGVGRFVWNMESDTCIMDGRLKALLGLDFEGDVCPSAEFFDLIDPANRSSVVEAAETARQDALPYKARFKINRADGSSVWIDARGKVVSLEAGDVLLGTNTDITEIMRTHEQNEILAAEMAHRVKNILSLVSGIFRMAAQSSDDVASLETAFLGRIQSLGALNDLTLRSATRSASAKGIAEAVLAAIYDDTRFSTDIDPIQLNGPAAQTICLALNELMTNSMKYGALSEEGGRVEIGIKVDEAADTFRFFWREKTTFAVIAPDKTTGFGMKVLKRMTKSTFKGAPKLDWRSDGLWFECTWAASEMSI